MFYIKLFFKKFKIFFLFFLTAFLAACAPVQPPVAAPEPVCICPSHDDKEWDAARHLEREKKYNDAIAAYQKIARESDGMERGANALMAEAVVWTIFDNPRRDIAIAGRKFEDFIKAYPNN